MTYLATSDQNTNSFFNVSNLTLLAYKNLKYSKPGIFFESKRNVSVPSIIVIAENYYGRARLNLKHLNANYESSKDLIKFEEAERFYGFDLYHSKGAVVPDIISADDFLYRFGYLKILECYGEKI